MSMKMNSLARGYRCTHLETEPPVDGSAMAETHFSFFYLQMLHVPVFYLKQFLPVETLSVFTQPPCHYIMSALFQEKAIGQGGAEYCLLHC